MRKNNWAEMSVTEQLEVIREDICDKICRWREYSLNETKDREEALEYLTENYCEHCPLRRL